MFFKDKYFNCRFFSVLALLFLFPSICIAAQISEPGGGVLRAASEYDYPPFALVKPDGSADGFSVDLLKAVTKAAGLEIRIDVGPWHEIKQQLIDGRLDVLPLVSFSKERARVMDFTASYLRMHGTIFIRKGDKRIKSQQDLKDKEVIVMRGDTAHEYAVKEKLSDHLVLTDTFEEAMEMLSQGRHDAVVVQQLVGLQLIKKLGITNVVSLEAIQDTSLRPSGKALAGFEQKFCIAVREGNSKLLAQLNEGLAVIIANGTYDLLYHKWFGPILPPAPISYKQLFTYLLAILIPLLFLLMLFGIWYLKHQVAEKTKSLRIENQERKKAQEETDRLIIELQKALKEVKILGGLLPICADCKKIRDDKGYWNQLEGYIQEHSNAQFSHSLCPDCFNKYDVDD